MKKTSSLVWRFFDRLEENQRCVAVLCKLCDTQYKYFGNTTNLRTHLVNKHPIQWELLQNGTLDDSNFRVFDEDESTNQSTSAPRRKRFTKNYKNDNVDVLENSETDNENPAETNGEPLNIVRQMQASDEEWLNEEIYETVDYKPKRKKKYRTIKREVLTPPPSAPKYRVVQNPAYSKPMPECVVVDKSQKKDEYCVFGEYVGNRLRKFKNPQVRGNVQQLISTILWQAEYGLYDNMETVKRVLLHSVQGMDVEQIPEQVVIEDLTKDKEGAKIAD
ncbi:uncharacterized protein LOC123876878 isoform X2 [Maniola jurtina]|uniref:uncharacterized protein LOC123876878 isoform X2 n=1 Tax=Maniola jurtina TaxID=191418 RepID=UPI001E6897B1|nr:uncharacterized protein LOC123876878 isoform X2 [Maniola jurtina]